ncbi:fimbrial biogenesis chaperone [Solimonas sp. K1W22B-7]|uniref:fimbrial biogenesis chaperone n=1 Tax=Solimonas sp. K1W22B-7 TaxID=2303331 RepID=UPI0013C49825|nr:fimbria/pilus periplasmic chaperone [Solimonas sp. K1W22B-7]
MASLLVTTAVTAAGLSVTPISLEFTSAAPAQALWLSNTGDAPIDAQLRAYAWNQDEGKDRLLPTRDLVLSPPMIALQPGQKQLVRVIRTAATGPRESSYRILVDELPDPAKLQQGLHFVMQFSIPVFADTGTAAAPALEWRLAREGDKLKLITDNKGGGVQRSPTSSCSTARAAACSSIRACWATCWPAPPAAGR